MNDVTAVPHRSLDCTAQESVRGNLSLPHAVPKRAAIRLTKREFEIMVRISAGHKSSKVADDLFLSKRTVDFHMNNVFAKLKVVNRVQAIIVASQMGLLPNDPLPRRLLDDSDPELHASSQLNTLRDQWEVARHLDSMTTGATK